MEGEVFSLCSSLSVLILTISCLMHFIGTASTAKIWQPVNLNLILNFAWLFSIGWCTTPVCHSLLQLCFKETFLQVKLCPVWQWNNVSVFYKYLVLFIRTHWCAGYALAMIAVPSRSWLMSDLCLSWEMTKIRSHPNFRDWCGVFLIPTFLHFFLPYFVHLLTIEFTLGCSNNG